MGAECKNCGFLPVVLVNEDRCPMCGYDNDPFGLSEFHNYKYKKPHKENWEKWEDKDKKK